LLVGVLALVTDLHDTTIVPLLYGATELAAASCVLVAVTRRFGPVRPRIDVGAWRRALRAGRPILANNVARTAVYSFDIMLAAVLLGREAVGFYSAAYRPVMFAVSALAIFYVSFLASYSAAQTTEAEQLFRRSVLVAAALAVPAAAMVSVGAGPAVDVLFGNEYEPAAGVLAILIWSVPVLGISGAYAGALIAADRQDRLMRNNVIGAVANVLLNLLVLPIAGIQGAAAVTVATECLILALNARAVAGLGLEPSPLQLARAFLREHLMPAGAPSGER
jgi:O-antigen/teichoic acid export membrane protein